MKACPSSAMKRNFYEILNATNTATADELKSNYKQLILQCHPDKLQQQQQLKTHNTHKLVTNNDEANNSEFVAITEAWNCLKDPVKRKQYDAEQLLNKFHTHNNIYAHIKLSEMKKQLNTGEYFQGNDEVEADENDDQKVKESEENETIYLYTYDCRCGGQYIVDESAEQYCGKNNNSNHDHHYHHHETQIKSNDNHGVDDDDDDADSTQNNKNSPNKVANNGGDGSTDAAAAGSEGVVFIQPNHNDVEEEEEGGELIVECSECSLVIILNG